MPPRVFSESDFSDEPRKFVEADFAPEQQDRIAAAQELGKDRPSGGITPEEFLALPQTEKFLREEGPGRLRTIAETGAAVASIPLTGGLPFLARAGIMGAVGGATSLGSELFDPTQSGTTSPSPFQIGPERLPPALERARDVGLGFGLGEVLPGSAAGVGAGINRATRGLFRLTDPDRIIAQQAIQAGGASLPLAQATGRRPARIMQGLGEASILGGGRIQDASEAAVRAAVEPIEQVVQNLKGSLDREQLGRVVGEAIQGHTEAFLSAAESAYRAVDASSGGVSVAHAKAKAEAVRLLKTSPRLSGQSKALLTDLTSDPDALTFEKAQQIRSALLATARSSDEPIKGQAQGFGKKFAAMLDDAMETAAQGGDGTLLRAFRRANKLWKAGKERFNSKLIAGLADNPSTVVKAIGIAQDPTSIRKIRRTVKNPALWRQVQGEWLAGILQQSAENAPGNVLKGQNLASRLAKMGDPALKELLGESTSKSVQQMAKTLAIAQEFTGKGAGGINIRGAAEGAALSAMFLTGNPASAGIALTPLGLGFLVTSPRAARLLTEGIQAPAGSKAAARAFSQLSQIAIRSGLTGAQASADPNIVRLQN